jgi:hypothetical protein
MLSTAAIVTSCTQRKSTDVQIDLSQLGEVRGVKQLADAWQRLVAAARPAVTAATLYQGRSIADTVAVARHLSCPWYIVSAGLGLVRWDRCIPAYDCTAAAGSELCDRLTQLGATSVDWWAALTASDSYPLSRLIAERPTLLALPGSYLRMVHEDLSHLSTSQTKHLRIFTSKAGAAVVPAPLADCVMPYDDRLESVPGYSGTRADFAQRALRHFVEKLEAVDFDPDNARSKVVSALARLPKPSRPPGVRMSDDDIRRTLRSQWARLEGRSTRMLRYLRDDAGISCEQKRFSRIWRSLAAELMV